MDMGLIWEFLLLCALLMGCGTAVYAEGEKKHFLLSHKDRGVCRRLLNDVVMNIILVDVPEAKWDDAGREQLRQRVNRMTEWLSQQADAYGVQLRPVIRYYSAAAEKSLTIGGEHTAWVRRVLDSHPELPSFSVTDDRLASGPVLLCMNMPGRAFAGANASEDFVEYAVLYNNDPAGAMCHELMHLYGAWDYYVHTDAAVAARRHLGSSIMLPGGYERQVDSLTAYVIGWRDELDDAALAMLADTATLTEEDIRRASNACIQDGFHTEEKEKLVYTGMFQGGMYHGWGIARWRDGNVYEGQWEWGVQSGIGTLKWADGSVYTGGFRNGVYEGPGKLKYADGCMYTGEFSTGHYHGLGTLLYSNGNLYTGSFAKGKYHGTGTLKYADGTMYTGEFSEGNFHGMGTIFYADGGVYTGKFVNGRYNGKGSHQWKDGMLYIGEHQDNFREGTGTMFFANGDLYTGDWQKDQRSGQGTYVWPDKGSYTGGFQQGKLNGSGLYSNNSGTLMDGRWEDGSFRGK